MKPITIWLRFDKETGRFEHNHIEDGHTENLNAPIGRCPEQARMWKGGRWLAWHGYLDDSNCVRSYCENPPALAPRADARSQLT